MPENEIYATKKPCPVVSESTAAEGQVEKKSREKQGITLVRNFSVE